MPQIQHRIEAVIGLDVAKDTVAIHDRISGRSFTVDNTFEALSEALFALADRSLAVCEATGGHEDMLLCVLASLNIPTHRGDGGKISAFARSLRRAKTDRIDAEMLALYGAERGESLLRYVPAEDDTAMLGVLVRRRMDLVNARKIERTRAKAPRAHLIEASIARAMAFLDAEIGSLDAQIIALIAASPRLMARKAVIETIPGVGHTTATTLLALMPELGRLTAKTAASLAAVAPHPKDSGQTNLRRKTTGGRRELRPILFFAAMSAARGQNRLGDFYRKLLEKGKAKRLALVATMRKIVVIANARLAHIN